MLVPLRAEGPELLAGCWVPVAVRVAAGACVGGWVVFVTCGWLVGLPPGGELVAGAVVEVTPGSAGRFSSVAVAAACSVPVGANTTVIVMSAVGNTNGVGAVIPG